MNMLLVPAAEVLDSVLLFHLIDHEILLLSARSSVLQSKGRMECISRHFSPFFII
jgi:hypothetical protein